MINTVLSLSELSLAFTLFRMMWQLLVYRVQSGVKERRRKKNTSLLSALLRKVWLCERVLQCGPQGLKW